MKKESKKTKRKKLHIICISKIDIGMFCSVQCTYIHHSHFILNAYQIHSLQQHVSMACRHRNRSRENDSKTER